MCHTPDGKLASLTDANNHATNFAYDGLDRISTITYPLGSTETLTYDTDNNVTARKTRAGDTIGFAYDTLNRLTTKITVTPISLCCCGLGTAYEGFLVRNVSRAMPATKRNFSAPRQRDFVNSPSPSITVALFADF